MIEDYSVSRGGMIVRHVRLSVGRVVDTMMGTAELRRGETVDQRADRAYLLSTVRPEGNHDRRPVRGFDLYSGCGGFSLGLAEACRAVGRRFVAVAAVDVDQTALGIYVSNVRPAIAIQEDVRKLIDGPFDGRLTRSERGLRHQVGVIDVLLAGPPCQGFSALNNHTRGEDPKNDLYGRVARASQVLEPDHIIIENVASVRSYSPAVVARTFSRLQKLGYKVTEAVVPLVELGIPQLRRRHVVVATAAREASPEEIIEVFRRKPRDLRWAIGDLAGTRAARNFDRPALRSPENEKRMRYLREHRLWDLPDYLRPACHRDGDHSYKSMYGRLRWDLPAQTITSGYGSMGQGRYVHPNGRRTLTPHEAARLQLFPDWFDFGERTRTAWATTIGNAVPMKLSYVFGVWLLR